MKRLLLIPARGGSKGVFKKNIALLGGKPLISRTIEQALASRAGSVIVSTDCEEIAAIARNAGAELPFMRPAELATDKAGSFEVAEHALRWVGDNYGAAPEILVLLQPTSPFRSAEDIAASLKLLEESGAPAVISVCEARTHPWMIRRISSSGALEYFIEGSEGATRRQDFPTAYEVNGAVYAIRANVLLTQRTFQPEGTRAYVMPNERSLDIDSVTNLRQAEWHLAKL